MSTMQGLYHRKDIHSSWKYGVKCLQNIGSVSDEPDRQRRTKRLRVASATVRSPLVHVKIAGRSRLVTARIVMLEVDIFVKFSRPLGPFFTMSPNVPLRNSIPYRRR